MPHILEAAVASTSCESTSESALISNAQSFALIRWLHNQICTIIHDPYPPEELKSTAFQQGVLKPLLDACRFKPAVFHALFLNRIYFLKESTEDMASADLNISRSAVCELLAIKLSMAYSDPAQSFSLIRILTISYNPFSGCSANLFSPDQDPYTDKEIADLQKEGYKSASNALEMAILSEAKSFIATPIIQRVFDDIYEGRVTYLPSSRYSLIKDNYKLRGAEIYDWRNRPLLDHTLLRVPAIRSRIETANFIIMLCIFLAFQYEQTHTSITGWEILFNIVTMGFCLDEMASFLNTSYFSDLWNVLDLIYVSIYLVYLIIRLVALSTNWPAASFLAFDFLSVASIILLPRLVANIIKRNIVILGLQSMLEDFIKFSILACLSASGFFFAFYILADRKQTPIHIIWLMIRIFLGNSFLGFEEAKTYHPVFGPTLMAIFALYVNCLLITVLISILSNTFARVQQDATKLFLFEKAVKTLERMKSDALLEYLPPANLVALLIVAPCNFILSPRYLHKVHVAMVRITSIHVLLPIALYRRWQNSKIGYVYLDSKQSKNTERLTSSMPRRLMDAGSRTTLLARQVFEKAVSQDQAENVLELHLSHAEANNSKASATWTDLLRKTRTTLDRRDQNSTRVEERLDQMERTLSSVETMLQQMLKNRRN